MTPSVTDKHDQGCPIPCLFPRRHHRVDMLSSTEVEAVAIKQPSPLMSDAALAFHNARSQRTNTCQFL
jgi:hypothetical protein